MSFFFFFLFNLFLHPSSVLILKGSRFQLPSGMNGSKHHPTFLAWCCQPQGCTAAELHGATSSDFGRNSPSFTEFHLHKTGPITNKVFPLLPYSKSRTIMIYLTCRSVFAVLNGVYLLLLVLLPRFSCWSWFCVYQSQIS